MRITLALAALRRHATRTILATLGVAVATAMLLDMVMLSTGMRDSFKDLLLSKGFQLRLSPKGTLPYDTDATIPQASEIVAQLRSYPTIERVSPVLGASLHIPRGEQGITSFALGLDATQQGDYELLRGQDSLVGNTLVVSRAFLAAIGKDIGDTLQVAAEYDPQLRMSTGIRTFTIVGEAQFLYLPREQIAAALPLPILQAMEGESRRDRVSAFMLKVHDSVNVDSLRAVLEEAIPRVTVISTNSGLVQVEERLSYFRQLAFILGTVSLVVGFLLVTTVMTVSVNERIGEISVMRALGVSTWHIVQQIVLEGVAISVLGGLCGLGLGLATARYLNMILSDFPGLPMNIDFFLFQPQSALVAVGLIVLTGIAAGIYPAWRSAQLPIATTLRKEAIA